MISGIVHEQRKLTYTLSIFGLLLHFHGLTAPASRKFSAALTDGEPNME